MLLNFFLVYCHVKTIEILEETYETCLDYSIYTIYKSLSTCLIYLLVSSSGRGFDSAPPRGTAPIGRNSDLH
jgi:hypothetical protein